MKRLLYRILKEAAWLVLLPLSVTLHFCGFKRLPIRIEHVGHLATEFDTFVKAQRLGLLKKAHYFVLCPDDKVSNPHLLTYWHSYVKIFSNRKLCQFLEILTRRFFMRDNASCYRVAYFGTQPIYHINKLWGDRLPILSLTQEDIEWGKHSLDALGITKNQWFVCLHVREGGFLPHNELIQSHRNASIENTIAAIQEIIRRGGYVVRMGDSTMKPLPTLSGLIDYAHHPLKSARMDVILCAQAKFFLGCTSGLAFLSMIFGVPVAHANMIPMETLGVRSCDLSIPKLLMNTAQKRYLKFKEIMTTGLGGYFFTHQYIDAGITCIENSDEDILALACEMMDRLDDTLEVNGEDQLLHKKYMSLFKPGHYSYEATSRIAIAFLRKYQHLLT